MGIMGSDFLDFFRQIPTGMIACLCLSGFLLVASISYIVFARTRRPKVEATTTETTANSGFTSSAPPAYDTGELPDLDVLLNVPMPAAPLATAPVVPTRAVKPGTYEVKLSDTGESIQAAEVMVIMRDMDEGRLIVQLGDQTYSNLSSFPDSKNRFLKIMKELAGVVVAKPGSSTLSAEIPSSESASEPASSDAPGGLLSRLAENKAEDVPSVRDLLDTPNEPKKVVSAAPPLPLPDGTMPGDLPKFKLQEAPLAPRRGAGLLKMTKDQERELKKPVPELNIAQAIQAYLQYKLSHTPEYAARSINVSQAAGGGVLIEVDGVFYDAVGDVEDVEVRAFLAATIEEWQSRQ